jgi:hypothetical protein
MDFHRGVLPVDFVFARNVNVKLFKRECQFTNVQKATRLLVVLNGMAVIDRREALLAVLEPQWRQRFGIRLL